MDWLNKICNCTIPLCSMDCEDRTSHLGTGVLIKTSENYYLLSARHVFENDLNVIDKTTIKNVVYKKDNDAYPISGKFVCYCEENIDIIVCKLDSYIKDILSQYFEFLPSNLLLQGSLLRNTQDYCIVGYPIGKVRKVYQQNNTIARSIYGFLTAGEYADDLNFYVKFHKDKMISIETGLRVYAPNIKGMSGCGLWYKFQNSIYLVGIVYSFNNIKSIISAVKIDCVIECLKDKFKDNYE